MYKFTLALACLAYAGCGQQMQDPSLQPESDPVTQHDRSKALAGMLLAFSEGGGLSKMHSSSGLRPSSYASAARRAAEPVSSLCVCTDKACKKAGGKETLQAMKFLAGCHTGIGAMRAAQGMPAAQFQENWAKKVIEDTGCLAGCKDGPNILDTKSKKFYNEVFKPATVAAILETALDLDIPDAALDAYVAGKEAREAHEEGDFEEALGFYNTALRHAGTLRHGGARLLIWLLEGRADVYEEMGDEEKAQKDIANYEKMTELRYPVTNKLSMLDEMKAHVKTIR